MGAVVSTKPFESSDHLVYVRAEYATISVNFVKNDKRQISKYLFPALMMGQNASV
jgi:hypothetical protein